MSLKRRLNKVLKNKVVKHFLDNFAKTDKILLTLLYIWILFGFVIFVSASFGILARGTIPVSSLLLKQAFFVFLASVLIIVVSQIKFRTWIIISPYLFLASLFLTLLVFVPQLSFSSGGATRWLKISSFTLQPAEFLKVFAILFAGKIYLLFKNKIHSKEALFAFGALIFIVSFPLFMQPDNSNMILIAASIFILYFFAGAPIRYILYLTPIAALALTLVLVYRPYVKERILVYLGIISDPLGKSYQVDQSLIAISTGHIFGKGFGQGVQKFGYLPEPMGDSIFSTFAEEFGFVGASALIFIFLLFTLRVARLAKRSKNRVSAIVMLSLTFLLMSQALLNIGAMMRIAPLTGITLPFISLGGSSLLANAILAGLILSAAISSFKRRL